MGSRRLLVAMLAVAVLLVGIAVVSLSSRSRATDRQAAAETELADLEDQRAGLEAQVEPLRSDLADQQARLAAVEAHFAPPAVEAVTSAQATMVEGGCSLARSAARDGGPLPDADQVIDLTTPTVVEAHPALEGLDRWTEMIDSAAIQAEVDSCAADERAAVEAEAAAAAAAEAERLDSEPPCDPSQLTITSPVRGTYCVND